MMEPKVMTNVTNSVLYIGVTNSLKRRINEHAEGSGSAFTHKYNCTKLVYFETFPILSKQSPIEEDKSKSRNVRYSTTARGVEYLRQQKSSTHSDKPAKIRII